MIVPRCGVPGKKDEFSVMDSWWSTGGLPPISLGSVDEVEMGHGPGSEDYDTLLFYLEKGLWTPSTFTAGRFRLIYKIGCFNPLPQLLKLLVFASWMVLDGGFLHILPRQPRGK